MRTLLYWAFKIWAWLTQFFDKKSDTQLDVYQRVEDMYRKIDESKCEEFNHNKNNR